MNIILIIEIILVFVALMFFHELGHFIFAKRAGIFVREFSLGLGPKLFSIKKGETQYSLRILPFGAYVRMAGEDPEIVDINQGETIGYSLDEQGNVFNIYTDSYKNRIIKVDEIDLEHDLYIRGTNEDGENVHYSISREAVIHYEKNKTVQIAPWDRQFGSKSILNRFAAILAGPVFNIILAVVLLFISTMMLGVPSNHVQVGKVTANSPAEISGLQQGDIIIGVNNTEFSSYQGILDAIQNSPNKEITLNIKRDNQDKLIPITPKPEGDKGLIGVEIIQVWKDVTIGEASTHAVQRTLEMSTLIIDGFRQLFTGNVSMNDIAGPVGIMKITSDAAKEGLAILINWGALLSLYLGIFNLLPIPALDGSRLLFLTAEGLRGKPIDPQKESIVHLVGFAFLMLLMVVVTVNDVSRFFR